MALTPRGVPFGVPALELYYEQFRDTTADYDADCEYFVNCILIKVEFRQR